MTHTVHCTENSINVSPEMNLRGLILNSFIHVFSCSKIGRPILAIQYINRSQINVEIGRENIVILFWK